MIRSTGGIILISVLLLWSGDAQGTFELESTGSRARSVSLGGAFSTVAGDVDALWYNPAGLTQMGSMEVFTSYSYLYPELGIGVGSISLGIPLGGAGAFGAGASMLTGIDNWSDMVLILGYAYPLGSVSIGAGVKILRWSASSVGKTESAAGTDISKTSFSLDVGAIYNLGSLLMVNSLKAGVFVRDVIGPNISSAGNDGGKTPMEFGGGLSFEMAGSLTSLDVSYSDGVAEFRGGVEMSIPGPFEFAVRAGGMGLMDTGDQKPSHKEVGGELDFGFGFVFKGIVFDYAYVYPVVAEGLGGGHKASIGYRF